MTSPTLSERFWDKVVKAGGDECWLWKKPHTRGYGYLWDGERLRRISHVSWFLHTGAWPEQQMLHRCDNPPCVNPKHLFEGTPKTNMEDRDRKARRTAPIGCASSRSKLTAADVLWIREWAGAGWPTTSLARAFNVSQFLVWRVVARLSYQNV